MWPDPKPLDLVALYHGHGAKIAAYAGGPEPADFLEPKGRMLRVARSQSSNFLRASRRTGGGSSRSRLRKLGVVEDFIERGLRLAALLFHQTRIHAI